ncbi:MAG: hypothetical protein QTN59_10005 [Candidatus Electrothrix communis]|nr:MAG: hypothetical protein QTN59_10005 [Candidatus Electrothrix communis]
MPTVKTVGSLRPAPPGRQENSVPKGLPKIAPPFKAGVYLVPKLRLFIWFPSSSLGTVFP